MDDPRFADFLLIVAVDDHDDLRTMRAGTHLGLLTTLFPPGGRAGGRSHQLQHRKGAAQIALFRLSFCSSRARPSLRGMAKSAFRQAARRRCEQMAKCYNDEVCMPHIGLRSPSDPKVAETTICRRQPFVASGFSASVGEEAPLEFCSSMESMLVRHATLVSVRKIESAPSHEGMYVDGVCSEGAGKAKRLCLESVAASTTLLRAFHRARARLSQRGDGFCNRTSSPR